MLASYVIISPCRNEANFMRNTLDSVVKQSVLPALWVIVDDGSTDDTANILLFVLLVVRTEGIAVLALA